MKITLSAKELNLLRKVCHKFDIDESIKEELENAENYGYVKLEESHEEFAITISERPVIAVLETFNKLAPKVMQVIGALKGVISLVESLFNEDFMKEVNELTSGLTYNVRQRHASTNGARLDIDREGNITKLEGADVVIMKKALDNLMNEYSSKKDLQPTLVGRNIADSVYYLEKAIEKANEAKTEAEESDQSHYGGYVSYFDRDREAIIRVNTMGELEVFNTNDCSEIEYAIKYTKKEYDTNPQLHYTVIGKNMADTIRTLENALSRRGDK